MSRKGTLSRKGHVSRKGMCPNIRTCVQEGYVSKKGMCPRIKVCVQERYVSIKFNWILINYNSFYVMYLCYGGRSFLIAISCVFIIYQKRKT